MTTLILARKRQMLLLSFACFTAIGLVSGMLGVAWPSIRGTFGVSLDALAALLATSTVGFVIGSILAGQLVARVGVRRLVAVCNIAAAAAVAGYALAPQWGVIVALGLITGLAGGTVETALNIFVADNHSVRTMNWMHGSFGVGAVIGPLLMTAVISSGLGWRAGYAIAALLYLVLGLAFLAARRDTTFERGVPPARASAEEVRPRTVRPLESLRQGVVFFSAILFLLYTGVEVSAGQWSFTLFTESRGVSTYWAGIMTSVFWGMLTLGRILFGAAAGRIGIERLLRLSMAGAVFSSIVYLVPSLIAGFTAVTLLGLSLSAIFPTLTADTPNRVDSRHVANAIGLQTAAASIGFALLPGLAGALAERAGLESLGPFLVVSAILMLVSNEVVLWLVRRHKRRTAVAALTAREL